MSFGLEKSSSSRSSLHWKNNWGHRDEAFQKHQFLCWWALQWGGGGGMYWSPINQMFFRRSSLWTLRNKLGVLEGRRGMGNPSGGY